MAEARFVGMLDYLAALKRSKLTEDQAKMDALFQACVLDIENASPISMEVGTSLLKTLGSADLPEKWHDDLANLVQKKVQAGIGEQSLKKKRQNQHCENLPNYFLQSDWDEMAKNPGILKKCMTMSNRMALLGLLNPDEPTSVAVVAIAYVTAHKGPMDELRVNPMNALSTVRDFKSHIRNLEGFKKAQISLFPADPAELPEDLLRRAYGEQMPVKCPVDEMAVKFLCQVLPARDTHSSIRSMCGKPGLQQCQSGGMLSQLKQLLAGLGGGEGEELELTMLPPRKKRPLLALEAPSAGSAAMVPAKRPVAPAAPAALAAPDPAPQEDHKAESPQAAEVSEEALPKVQAQSKVPKKDVEDMANEVLKAIENPPPKVPKVPKAKKKATPKTKAASAAQTKAKEPSPKKKGVLQFPGEEGGPVRYSNVTIYVCPNSSSYRVKVNGEKKDKSFSWKMDGAKGAWNRVKTHLLAVA